MTESPRTVRIAAMRSRGGKETAALARTHDVTVEVEGGGECDDQRRHGHELPGRGQPGSSPKHLHIEGGARRRGRRRCTRGRRCRRQRRARRLHIWLRSTASPMVNSGSSSARPQADHRCLPSDGNSPEVSALRVRPVRFCADEVHRRPCDVRATASRGGSLWNTGELCRHPPSALSRGTWR